MKILTIALILAVTGCATAKQKHAVEFAEAANRLVITCERESGKDCVLDAKIDEFKVEQK